MHRSPERHLDRIGGAAGALLAMVQAVGQPYAPGPAPAPEPAATAADAPAPEASAGSVLVSDEMTVDLHLQDEDLANVLQMLSIQTQKNIVASRDVSASVTASLYGVTFYEALDAILHVNGYGYIERGNFIYVYTLEELQQIQGAERRPIAKVISLNYLNGNDAASFVTPLLSPDGRIQTNGDVGTFTMPDTPVGAESFALAATLVVYDYPDHVEEIERVLHQLDSRPAQVLVEATILQTSLTEANAFGVDFSVIGDMDFSDFVLGGPLGAFNALKNPVIADAGAAGAQTGEAIVSTPGNTGGPGTFKFGIVNDNFSVFVRMLDTVGDTTVLSNPKVLALNRQPARVLVGERLGYLSTTATETSTTQTVEFLDTGTQLAFRPFIANDGMIRMELRPSVSTGVIRNGTDSNGSAVTIPDEITQEITTNVLVRDGSTIVLGGLFKESTTLSRQQVPVIGDIPIIGAPFRGHEDSTQRSEIIFMITPTIVSDKSLLDDGERALEYTERVRAGTRQGLLPWSRERTTAKLNLEAEELAREGQREQALWKLRRSLELHPNQPDAIRMRERLSGEQDRWPSRELLDEIIHQRMEKSMQDWPQPPVAPPVPVLNSGGPPAPTPQAAASAEASPSDLSAWIPNFGALAGAPTEPKEGEQ